MFKCEFCGKEYQDKSPFSNHVSHCPKNPNRTIQKNFREKNIIEPLIDDNGKLYSKYLNKRNNAKKENIEFQLSYLEFCQLVRDAGLKCSDLGFSGKGYVLARIGDIGAYSFSNCRFITQLENARERKVSEKSREASRSNAAKMNASQPANKGELIRSGMAASPYYQNLKKQAAQKAVVADAKKHPSYTGIRNSQFGTYWITDGLANMKWSDAKGDIPNNYRRGRVLNK